MGVFDPPAPYDPQPPLPNASARLAVRDLPRKLVTIFGMPVRVDRTLCAPGEIWLEFSDGEAVRVYPK